MKKNFTKFLLALLVVGGGFQSCKKANLNSLDDADKGADIEKLEYINGISVVNNTFHFETLEAYDSIYKVIMDMNPEEFKSWESENNFKSMRSNIDEVYEEISECRSQVELDLIISKNSDIIFKHEEGIFPKVDLISYQSIANKDGFFSIAGNMHKVTKDTLYVSNNNSIKDINEVILNNIHSLHIDIIPLKSVKILGKTNDFHQYDFKKFSKIDGNKRQEIYLYYGHNEVKTNGVTHMQKEFRITSYSHKKVLGAWWSYNTTHAHNGVSFKVSDVPTNVVNDDNGNTISIDYKDMTYYIASRSPSGEYSKYTWYGSVGEQVINWDWSWALIGSEYLMIHGEFKTRGISSFWSIDKTYN